MTGSRRRVTQQDIARMTGVSQATVSVVLNGRSDSDVRIAPETREKVLRAIAETGYIADPVARRLAARHNRIIGVFTSEPVFPSANSDFYHPFLVGIEQRAEALGSDLLLLTSAPVVEGRRRLFHEDNRVRLSDGCVLLGRLLDRNELSRLVADGFPFVSIGRRDDAGGPVPYVGADYPAAVKALVERAVALGHPRLAYLGHGAGPESWADRMRGFRAGAGELGWHFSPAGLHALDRCPSTCRIEAGSNMWRDNDLAERLDLITAAGITVVLAEDHADGVALYELARQRGLDLSVATLGEPTRTPAASAIEFSGFRIPRRQMGSEAVEVLAALIEGQPTETQRILPCDLVAGETMGERK